MPEQSRRNHTSVVQHQQVIRTQEIREVSESKINVFARTPLEVEHACGCPIGQWALCDEFFREVKIEVRDEHSPIIEAVNL
jgi:hypothetical protein